jgi:hypothetical protein
MAMDHGNSDESNAIHHLYEIRDRSESNGIFKYGISGRSLNSDGTSPRAEEQIEEYNLITGWLRFFANILMIGIPGRKKAKEIERKYITDYEKIHGRKPRGNLR